MITQELRTKPDFEKHVAGINAHLGYRRSRIFGIGYSPSGAPTLDDFVWEVKNEEKNYGSDAIFQEASGLLDARAKADIHLIPVNRVAITMALERFAFCVEEARQAMKLGHLHTHANVQALLRLERKTDAELEKYYFAFVFFKA